MIEEIERQAASRDSRRSPAVSVVVPTYRRDHLLHRLLGALAAQRPPAGGFQIIVVDDARGYTVPAVVGGFAACYPWLDVRALVGPGRGPAAARNAGWRAARGDIVAFVDDDAFPANDEWLQRGIEAFEDASIDGVSGRVVVPLRDAPTDFQRNVHGLQRGVFLTCNAFYRRSALERVSGFDERFTVPYREDSDLQFRVEDSGGELARAPLAVVVHPAPRGSFGISLKLQRYSMFNALLYKKHRARFRSDVEARPPLHYYAIVASAGASSIAAARGHGGASALLAAPWLALEARFFWRRVRGTTKQPAHLADMALTSLLIPWLSVYWRLRGALRFRTLFF